MKFWRLKTGLRKVVRDPFLLLVITVITIPALLVVVAIARQGNEAQTTTASNSSFSKSAEKTEVQSDTTLSSPAEPKPITQAEQPAVLEDKKPILKSEESSQSKAVCNSARKQAAQAERDSAISKENAEHQHQKDKLRLITLITRKYWNKEQARHQNALDEIEADYQAALTKANC